MDLTQVSFSQIRSTFHVNTTATMPLRDESPRLVRASLPDNLSGLFDAVPVLRTGEAIITGDIVKLPTRVVIESSKAGRPDSADPEVVGRILPGGWDAPRVPQDYADVAWAWRHLTPHSRRVIRAGIDNTEKD